MGGMQALEWAVSYPESVAAALPIACTARHSAQQIAFNEVGRQAIMADPDWSEGNYYGKQPPGRGLSVARMVGHTTYIGAESMRKNSAPAGREKKTPALASKLISKGRAICATAAASSSIASTP